MTRQRITVISIVSILIFSLLLGGKIIYENQWLEGSLVKESLQITGVISTELVNRQGVTEMVVRTNKIENLQSISQELKKISGEHPIRFVDQRSSQLEEVFQQMQFAIQEGIVMGNFTQMRENLLAQAHQAEVIMDLAMDNEAIYLTLTQGENQLISVIERHGQGIFLPSEGSSNWDDSQ